jgi:hypothetical protein
VVISSARADLKEKIRAHPFSGNNQFFNPSPFKSAQEAAVTMPKSEMAGFMAWV